MPDVVIAHVDEDFQPHVVIRHGLLRRVVGSAARHGGTVFVPVWFSFDTEPRIRQKPSYPLSAFVADPPPTLAACRDEYGESMDAAWVRARIPAVFRFAPATLIRPECKYSLVDHAFVACSSVEGSNVWEAIPFVCVSDDLKAMLIFSPDGSEDEVRQRIAAAFWGLLLSEPNDLHTFRDGYMSCRYDEDWVTVEYRGDRFSVDFESEEDGCGEDL